MPARLAGAFLPSIRARDVQANSAAAFCAGFFLALSPFGTIRGKSRVNANRWRNAAIWLFIARESIAGNPRHEERRNHIREIAHEGVSSARGTSNGFPRFPLCYSAMRW